MISLLAVDVGGTKSRVGLFDIDDSSMTLLVEAVYANALFTGVEAIVEKFLAEFAVQVRYACFGVAGVVENGGVKLTNLAWTLRVSDLARRFSFLGVWLINDLTALAEGIPLLQEKDTYTLQQGDCITDQAVAIIAPGTGLGQGYFLRCGNDGIARGTEGGHSRFAPGSEVEIALLGWLMQTDSSVSAEQVCSGPAIATLFRFCREHEKIEPAPWLEEKMRGVADLTPIIVEGAIEQGRKCPLCLRTMEIYLAILGRESANLALKLYARGGVYLGGGIIPRLIDRLSFTPFLRGFRDGGKMRELLATIPIRVILRNDIQIYGAANYGRRMCLLAPAMEEE